MSKWPQPFVSTVSHWQATNRGRKSLYNHNKETPLPTEIIDYVVVGAGMAGTTMAYHLTRPGVADGKTVAVLEAKDLASGASGRNGGHCAPYSFGSLTLLTDPLSEGGAGLSIEEAIEVIDFEKRVLEYVTETIEDEKWDVDFWKGEKVEVRISEAAKTQMRENYAKWVEAREKHPQLKGTEPEWYWNENAEEAKKATRIHNAIAYSKGPAGSVHPHKLATAYMKAAIATGRADLYSYAPVQSAKKMDGVWELEVHDKGTIKAREVIFCTNAHTPHLFEGSPIAEYLVPFQAQAANVTPPLSYSGSKYLANSYTIEDGPYLIFTPDNGLVLGLHHAAAHELGVMTKQELYVDDDAYVAEGIAKWLRDYCKNNFSDWGPEAPGEGAMRIWAGMLCATKDTLPLIGAVPGKEGMYMAAGFHGHGMARIALGTKYLAKLMTTGEWDEGLPKTFDITEERFERGKIAPPFITEEEKNGTLAGKFMSAVGLGGSKVVSVVR
ncbi:uncharacterized protein I303_105655 [Kwoniella dejecticola CBS 10117]|uniref:FAD dependent oxidoreductase domain-containing protein n=1 Tax=Kwoniella dejecticola CBS 10117 TaxID=1296121 RepID=A0A1A6A015_9TREE|nr:uncharacterized protein I303_05677 [Kwoniella dejecticola CBS 10117]OBR83399.1 hypothetical protein I303_05677 [Kwoniella dejecticola CBS 10117]